MSLSREQVLEALKSIAPEGGIDIVTSGVMRALNVDGAIVRFVMEIDPAQAEIYMPVKTKAEEILKSMGAADISVVMTAHKAASAPPDLKVQKKAEPKGPTKVPGVDRILAVASGKGGVGKSTVSANLACALAAEGRRVGLLDADVYGPSQPRMMGVSGRPSSADGKTIIPMRNHGVTMMSIGLMTNEGQAVVSVAPVNDAPVAVDDEIIMDEDTVSDPINVLDNDSDPDGDEIFVDMAALPDGTIIPIGVATEIPEGTLTINADGSVTFEPRLDFFGPVTFGYTISDGQGGTDVATVTT